MENVHFVKWMLGVLKCINTNILLTNFWSLKTIVMAGPTQQVEQIIGSQRWFHEENVRNWLDQTLDDPPTCVHINSL